MTMLSHGCRGPDVAEAQAALNFHAGPGDADLVPDGIFGDRTRARTMAFQKQAGLVPDGIIGPLTTAVLLATTEVVCIGRTLYRKQPERPVPVMLASLRGAGMPGARAGVLLAQAAPLQPPFQPLPPLPPLSLPTPGAPPLLPGWKLKLKVDIPLLSGVPVSLPQRPPAPSIFGHSLEIFVLKGSLLRPLGSQPGPTSPIVQQTTTSRFEAQTWTMPGPAQFGRFSLDLYAKAKIANDPMFPADTAIKFLGGASMQWTQGRFVAGASVDVPFFKFSSPDLKATWGPKPEANLSLMWLFD